MLPPVCVFCSYHGNMEAQQFISMFNCLLLLQVLELEEANNPERTKKIFMIQSELFFY